MNFSQKLSAETVHYSKDGIVSPGRRMSLNNPAEQSDSGVKIFRKQHF
jgi:hypothetical protein